MTRFRLHPLANSKCRMATCVNYIRKQWDFENGPELNTVQACIPKEGSLPSITFRHLCAKCSGVLCRTMESFLYCSLRIVGTIDLLSSALKPLITRSDLNPRSDCKSLMWQCSRPQPHKKQEQAANPSRCTEVLQVKGSEVSLCLCGPLCVVVLEILNYCFF